MKAGWTKYLPALKRIYGSDDIPYYVGSAYEGEGDIDDAELIIHELCHMTKVTHLAPYPLYNMEGSARMLGIHLRVLTKKQQDKHEIHAIATELLVAKRLEIPLCKKRLIAAGMQNSQLYTKRKTQFQSAVNRYSRQPDIIQSAKAVVRLILAEHHRLEQGIYLRKLFWDPVDLRDVADIPSN